MLAGTKALPVGCASFDDRAWLQLQRTRRALRWALEGIVCQHLTVARVAEGLAVSWNTANDAVLVRVGGPCSATRPGSTASTWSASRNTCGGTVRRTV